MDPPCQWKEAERNRHARVASREPEAMALKYPRLRCLGVAPKRNRPRPRSRSRSKPFRIPSSQQPGDRLPSPHHHHLQAMDLFPDGGFVRLESRETGKYVHAEGDWLEVSLRPNDPVIPSLDAVWRVQHWASPDQGVTYVLLQNAAYGRYLSYSLQEPMPGHHGRRATQSDRDEPHVLSSYPWMWTVERLDHPDQDYVGLRYFNCYLRANGSRYAGVTVDAADGDPGTRISTMMHWTVHEVAASPVPQPLPVPVTLQHQGDRRGVIFWRRTRIRGLGVFPHPPRTIRHVRANDEGDFDQNHNTWRSFAFYDSSVSHLRHELGQLQDDWNGDMFAFTLCIRPGLHGRLMPLFTDLPRNLDSMDIIVIRTGSPAAAALVYPAPAPPYESGTSNKHLSTAAPDTVT